MRGQGAGLCCPIAGSGFLVRSGGGLGHLTRFGNGGRENSWYVPPLQMLVDDNRSHLVVTVVIQIGM